MNTVVVTGATSGIGYAVCEALLKQGFRVIGIGHSEANCTAALTRLKLVNKAYDIIFLHGDLMQQAEVRRLAAEIRQLLGEQGALYALINNAGCVRSWYMTTGEGYEQQFALNHLAGFLLTHELLPNLLVAKGRVLFTSSGSHKRMKMHWNDLMFQKRYRPLYAYKQSKLANMLFAYSLNERYGGRGIKAFGVDPGLVRTSIGNKNTGKLVDYVWRLRKSGGVDPKIPAKVYETLCTCEADTAGLYQGIKGKMKHSREVSKENADRLFELSEKLCKIKFGVVEAPERKVH
jgi:NAD(P)-dependent dehydrogenase (short-subunit alcohol dehydrogenase family)